MRIRIGPAILHVYAYSSAGCRCPAFNNACRQARGMLRTNGWKPRTREGESHNSGGRAVAFEPRTSLMLSWETVAVRPGATECLLLHVLIRSCSQHPILVPREDWLANRELAAVRSPNGESLMSCDVRFIDNLNQVLPQGFTRFLTSVAFWRVCHRSCN